MENGSMSLKNKWKKTKWLTADRALRRYVPETMLFTRTALREMAARYRMIYFKPTDGTGGNGIARIKRISDSKFSVRTGMRTSAAYSEESLYEKLKAMARGRSYLLQKGIVLMKAGGRPFDIRVMVQKPAEGKWVPTAMFVKLGKPGKVATNYHQGGALRLLDPTLRRAGYTSTEIASCKKRLTKLGLKTARCFDRHGSRFKELGLDVAIDRKGRLWILEVNTRPNIYALKTMPDAGLYRTVVRYSKQYGRQA